MKCAYIQEIFSTKDTGMPTQSHQLLRSSYVSIQNYLLRNPTNMHKDRRTSRVSRVTNCRWTDAIHLFCRISNSFSERRAYKTDMQRSLYFYVLKVFFYKGKHFRNLLIYFGISSKAAQRYFAPAVAKLTYGCVHSKFLPEHKGI